MTLPQAEKTFPMFPLNTSPQDTGTSLDLYENPQDLRDFSYCSLVKSVMHVGPMAPHLSCRPPRGMAALV